MTEKVICDIALDKLISSDKDSQRNVLLMQQLCTGLFLEDTSGACMQKVRYENVYFSSK